ncbi:MAG: DUF922 domain-containing protein [Acidobacteriota bacterium]
MRLPMLACLFLAAAACTQAPGARLPPDGNLVRPALVETLPPDSIRWSQRRRLSWSDFRGAPQIGAYPSAVTSYVLLYTSTCDAKVFTSRVDAAFVPRQSWVKTSVVLLGPASRRALQHEQTHFDLAEIDARRIRRALASLATPCEMTSDERNAVVARFMQEDEEIQERYDRESGHGIDAERQGDWESTVARQLAALARYRN